MIEMFAYSSGLRRTVTRPPPLSAGRRMPLIFYGTALFSSIRCNGLRLAIGLGARAVTVFDPSNGSPRMCWRAVPRKR